MPVEKTVENFPNVSNRQFKKSRLCRSMKKACANLLNIVRKKVEKNIFLMKFYCKMISNITFQPKYY